MINALIIDDHAVVRHGVQQILDETPDISLVKQAATAQKGLELTKANKFTVVILDISLPDKNGLDVLKELKIQQPNLPVIILSFYSEEQYAIRAFKSGASGYLSKNKAPEELVKAIREVARGKRYLPLSLADKIAWSLGPENEKLPHERLSDRELEVMLLIVAGKANKEIANHLCLSEKTISTYRHRILEKMYLKNSIELALYATHNNLID